MQIMSIPGLWGQFLHDLFFKMIYVTLIVSSNRPGDVSHRPLLPGLFWSHFLPPNFLVGHQTKVAIHSASHSLPLSPLRQQPYLKSQTTEPWPSDIQARCISRSNCHLLTNWNRAITQDNLDPRVLQVPLLFGKHPLIYMHVLVCFAVECETVCS
jgi:hypothetical protein